MRHRKRSWKKEKFRESETTAEQVKSLTSSLGHRIGNGRNVLCLQSSVTVTEAVICENFGCCVALPLKKTNKLC